MSGLDEERDSGDGLCDSLAAGLCENLHLAVFVFYFLFSFRKQCSALESGPLFLTCVLIWFFYCISIVCTRLKSANRLG